MFGRQERPNIFGSIPNPSWFEAFGNRKLKQEDDKEVRVLPTQTEQEFLAENMNTQDNPDVHRE